MPDIITDSLEIIEQALLLISKRFTEVPNPEAFMESDYGLLLLDAISMRLQVIGEKSKRLSSIVPAFGKSRHRSSSHNTLPELHFASL